jgi:hypothetical protein
MANLPKKRRKQSKRPESPAPPKPAKLPIRWFSTPAAQGFFLLLACFLVYLPSLRAGFIWDDDVLITGNPLVASPSGLPGIWSGQFNPDYFPVTSTLFWLEYRLWGANPFGYHFVNILLHGVAVLLLWRLLLCLRLPAAWGAALLFAVHPVAVATVAWVAEGKNTLATALALAATLLFLADRDQPPPDPRQPRRAVSYRFAAALFCFLLALLSKTAVVMLPVALLLCLWWRAGRVTRSDLARLSPFFVLSLIMGLVTVWFQAHRAIEGAEVPIGSLFDRFCSSGKAICFYAFKVVAPVHLGVIYPAWTHSPLPGLDALAALSVIGSFAVAWRFRTAWWGRGFLFGFGAFVLLLLPILGLAKMYFFVFAPVADHLEYVALPAGIALVVSGFDRIISDGMGAFRKPGPWGLALVAVAFGWLSWTQCAFYMNQKSLWNYALLQNPRSFRAQLGCALVLLDEGRVAEAAEHARLAVQENPRFLKARLNYALILDQARQYDQAISEFTEALKIDPNLPDAHVALGNVFFETGRFDRARIEYDEAVRLDPRSAEAHNNLGAALLKDGLIPEARIQFEAALKLNPEHAQARRNLNKILLDGAGSPGSL